MGSIWAQAEREDRKKEFERFRRQNCGQNADSDGKVSPDFHFFAAERRLMAFLALDLFPPTVGTAAIKDGSG